VILVDTSVWIDHLRSGEPSLAAALEAGRVMMHPFVLGELACGNLANRSEVLELLGNLPAAPTATDPEAVPVLDGPGCRLHRRALVGFYSSVRRWTSVDPGQTPGRSGDGPGSGL
jgi:hypothetical protein